MGLRAPLERGLALLCDEAKPRLAKELGEQGAANATEALRAMPRVLEALNAVAWDASTPESARALFAIVASYLLKTDDLVPARDGQEALGLMDDAYLLFRAAGNASSLLGELSGEDLALKQASLRLSGWG